jgi:hypothetical protein
MLIAHAYPVGRHRKKTNTGKLDAEGRTFWRRLEIASEWAGVDCSPSAIATELHVWPSAVTKYVEGGFPAKDKINQLAVARKVKAEWLLSGHGDMVEEKLLDTETQEFLRLWRTLDRDAKGRLVTIASYESTIAQTQSTGRRLQLTDEMMRKLQNDQDSTHKPL